MNSNNTSLLKVRKHASWEINIVECPWRQLFWSHPPFCLSFLLLPSSIRRMSVLILFLTVRRRCMLKHWVPSSRGLGFLQWISFSWRKSPYFLHDGIQRQYECLTTTFSLLSDTCKPRDNIHNPINIHKFSITLTITRNRPAQLKRKLHHPLQTQIWTKKSRLLSL